jgi:hypothetical protein
VPHGLFHAAQLENRTSRSFQRFYTRLCRCAAWNPGYWGILVFCYQPHLGVSNSLIKILYGTEAQKEKKSCFPLNYQQLTAVPHSPTSQQFMRHTWRNRTDSAAQDKEPATLDLDKAPYHGTYSHPTSKITKRMTWTHLTRQNRRPRT